MLEPFLELALAVRYVEGWGWCGTAATEVGLIAATMLGFRVVTAPGAVAFHHFGGSTRDSRGMLWRELMGERHNIRALIKNYQFPNLVRALAGLILLPQPRSRKLGQLRNLLWNLWVLPDTLRERHRISRRRVRNDRDLAHLIVKSKDVPITL